jgi:hypothetical protein
VNFGVPERGNISSQHVVRSEHLRRHERKFPTGSINNVSARQRATPKTSGKWNAYEISRQGDHVKVVLNGETVVDITTTLHPGGHIALQASRRNDADSRTCASRRSAKAFDVKARLA